MSLLKYESQQREPLVDGNKDYHQVTEDIIGPIEMKPSKLWYIGFYISVGLLLFGVYSVYREVTYGIGQWNLNKTIGWLGLGYHQFRMVGRYRSRGNAYFCDLIIIPPGLENRCEPCSRSDDDLCSNVRRPVPDMAYGACVDGILRITLSKQSRTFMGEL